jgi:hypothetical protein
MSQVGTAVSHETVNRLVKDAFSAHGTAGLTGDRKILGGAAGTLPRWAFIEWAVGILAARDKARDETKGDKAVMGAQNTDDGKVDGRALDAMSLGDVQILLRCSAGGGRRRR